MLRHADAVPEHYVADPQDFRLNTASIKEVFFGSTSDLGLVLFVVEVRRVTLLDLHHVHQGRYVSLVRLEYGKGRWFVDSGLLTVAISRSPSRGINSWRSAAYSYYLPWKLI